MNWRLGIMVGMWLGGAVMAAAMDESKTMRVDHGRPVILVGRKQVLLLEFLKTSAGEALVRHEEPNIRHCRAQYRYRLFDRESGQESKGEGTVEEVIRTISRSATGAMVDNAGSKTTLGAGDISLWWSEATAGVRSWIYYRATGGIRFLQQPQQLRFEEVTPELFRQYLKMENVQLLSAGKQQVTVIGPAVFSGDLPTEAPITARIKSTRLDNGRFHLELADLATNKTYRVESSYELRSGNWNVVHTFPGRGGFHNWSDPVNPTAPAVFYRIQEDR